MDEKILEAIDQEIEKLRQARALLAGTDGIAAKRVVREKPKRMLSAEARKAIADAQRKRWAKIKSTKATKPATKK